MRRIGNCSSAAMRPPVRELTRESGRLIVVNMEQGRDQNGCLPGFSAADRQRARIGPAKKATPIFVRAV